MNPGLRAFAPSDTKAVKVRFPQSPYTSEIDLRPMERSASSVPAANARSHEASPALDLHHGRLWLLGGVTECSERISWLPPAATGWERLNAYLVLEPDRALLIDTGVAKHGADLLEQLASLIGARPLDLYLTRFEFDCIGNVGEIMREFDVPHVYASGGAANPLPFFEAPSSRTDPVPADRDVFTRVQPGEPFPVGAGRELEAISPLVRVLATSWVYDGVTRTLFSSDAFGHAQAGAPDQYIASDDTSADQVREHLFTKFDWLQDVSRPDAIARHVMEIFESRDVLRIAPTHGCVIEGRATVARHLTWLCDAVAGSRRVDA